MKRTLIPSHDPIDRCDAKSEQHMNGIGGSVCLRNILFVLFLGIALLAIYFYESDEVPALDREPEVLKKIERIKPGMSQMQVRSIVGSPLRIDQSPFSEDSLPIKNPELQNSRESENLLLSIKRDIFEMKFIDSANKTRAYGLEVYYDNYSTVCYIHHYLYPGLVWDLVEMY